jgi:hypothetical protein
MTESAIRARFVRDSFHSLSTGAPTAFPEAWRACFICPICPLRSGERPQCDVGWAALYLRWLGPKIGRFSDILLAHHDDLGDAAWFGEIDRAAEDGGAYLRGQRCLIHRDARAWNLETDDAAPPIYRESACSG